MRSSIEGALNLVTIEDAMRLGAIVAHKDGNHGSLYPRVDEFGPEGVPFLTAKLLSEGRVDIASAPRLPDVHADKLKLGFVQPDDVLLSHNATIGRVAIVPRFEGRLLIGTSLTYFRVNKEVLSPRYLAAYFQGEHFQRQLSAVMSQTTRNQVPITSQRRLQIALPPIQVQEAIASVLGALDDRIALLRETNATLEAIAQALFKSWFVDFDAVRAKSKGLAPAGLDEATAALFPNSFEDSQRGSIPAGWSVKPIYEFASVIYGAPFASSKFNGEGIGRPLIRIRDLRDEAPGVCTPEVHIKGYVVRAGDIVVGMDGEFRAYLWGGEEAWLNQRVCVFAPKHRVPAAFVRSTIEPLLAHVEATETATTVIHLGKNDIDRFRALVPNPELLLAFSSVVDPVYARIVSNKQTARTLATLRDTLLPRLISGQLRLPDAEALAASA